MKTLLIATAFLFLAAPALAGTIPLQWDAVGPADAYTVYYGTAPDTLDQTQAVPGTDTTAIIEGLPDGVAHFFRVTRTLDGVESGMSEGAYGTPVMEPPAGVAVTEGN